MEYLQEILITLAILIVIIAASLWGWRNMHRRHSGIPAPASIPETLSEPSIQIEGTYVSTTQGQDWLARVHAHGLGNRSNAMVSIHPEGVAMWREGEENYFIPSADIEAVSYGSGQAGKFVEKDGLLLVNWSLGDKEHMPVQTGFRTRYAADKKPLRDAIQQLTKTTTKENNA